jgi:hypothetical protein
MVGSYSTDSLFWTGTNGSGSTTMYIGNKTIDTSVSDIRLKDNIEPSKIDALKLIGQMDVVDFDWKEGMKERNRGRATGLIAQDVIKYLPQVVIKPDDPEDMWAVEYQHIVPYLIKAVQTQQKEIDDLKARLDKLEQATEGE